VITSEQQRLEASRRNTRDIQEILKEMDKEARRRLTGEIGCDEEAEWGL